jgi:hypothetical protein
VRHSLTKPVDSLPAFSAVAIFVYFALVTFLTYYALQAEEPTVWAFPVTIPWHRVVVPEDRGCSGCLMPSAFVGTPDAQGEIRVDIRRLNPCRPWQGGQLLNTVFWLPQASSQLDGYLQHPHRDCGGSFRFLVAPDDMLKHEYVIAFLDALKEAGAAFIAFVDTEDRCH